MPTFISAGDIQRYSIKLKLNQVFKGFILFIGFLLHLEYYQLTSKLPGRTYEFVNDDCVIRRLNMKSD